jgi:hypothetical protein
MLNLAGFQLGIDVAGERLEWYRALPCSCYDPVQNYDAQRGCDKCNHGQIYRSAGTATGIVTKQRSWVMHPELGWLQVSELSLQFMPADMRLGPYDKVVLLDRETLARERLHRGADTLAHLYPTQVNQIADDDTVYVAGTDYTVNLTTRAVTWLTAGPTNVYAVEYLYHPEYWFVFDSGQDTRPAGGMQDPLPQRVKLSLSVPPG